MGRKSKEQLEKEDMKKFEQYRGASDYSHISNKLRQVRRQIELLQTKEQMLLKIKDETKKYHNNYMRNWKKKKRMEKKDDGQISESTETP